MILWDIPGADETSKGSGKWKPLVCVNHYYLFRLIIKL